MFRKFTIAISFVSLLLCSAALAGKASASINKVRLVSVVATPMPPVLNQPLTITFVVENLQTARKQPLPTEITVAWTLSDKGAVVASGEVALTALEKETVQVPWDVTIGPHSLTLSIDPKNALVEAGTGLADNSKSLPAFEVSPEPVSK